jgi:hypothetical protein
MRWVYLSPHFDDVALSCGGLVWEQSHAGEPVSIWTICAGKAPRGEISPFAARLHQRWQTSHEPVAERRLEDQEACAILGATYQHFDIPDAIYRQSKVTFEPSYPEEDSIFGEVHPEDYALVADLSDQFIRQLPGDTQLVCPLSLGDHVDHKLVRKSAEKTGLSLIYYADYPYILKDQSKLILLDHAGWEKIIYPLSEKGMDVWVKSIAAYRSQISTFWQDREAMCSAIHRHYQLFGGICLWKNPHLL